jgi:hypothetical protein
MQALAHQGQATLLKRVLVADAVFSILSGALFVVAAGPIAGLLGINASWIISVIGIDLMIFAGLMWLAAQRTPIVKWHIWGIIAIDALWVLASLELTLGGLVSFTTFGFWAVLIVADVVLLIGILKIVGLRKLQR